MVSSPAYAQHPDHTITVTPHEGRVTVRFGGEVVAETERALVLKEAIAFADEQCEFAGGTRTPFDVLHGAEHLGEKLPIL